MARASCPFGYRMWDGDGKPVIWASRTGFFRETANVYPEPRKHPYGDYWTIYDYTDDYGEEESDIWFCDECQSLTVWLDEGSLCFMKMESIPEELPPDLYDWEEYMALRDWDFDRFQDYFSGKKPLEAIETYSFKYMYRVSPDQRYIYALNTDKKVEFGFEKIER